MILKTQLMLLMKTQGLTAAELSRRSSVPRQALSLWLTGTEPKHITQVQMVAKALGVTIDELCFGASSPETENVLSALSGDGWASGIFEVKFRRVRR